MDRMLLPVDDWVSGERFAFVDGGGSCKAKNVANDLGAVH
jgi:hypothetical protein